MFILKNYKKLSNNEEFNVKKNSNIFMLKKSLFIQDKNIKRITQTIPNFLVLLIIIIILFTYMYKDLFKSNLKKEKIEVNEETTKKENKIEYLKLNKEENNSTLIIGNKKYDRNLVNKTYDFQKEHFIILRRSNGFFCGLFSYYSVHLGCIILYLSKGLIPIIDVSSFSNIFNNFIPSNDSNPWEILFNQPFNYTLAEVKKMLNIL